MSNITQFDCKDHWEEKIIILEKRNDNNEALGFSIGGGIDNLYMGHHLNFIIVTHIAENGLAQKDKRLQLYDVILRVNNFDFTHIKHRKAFEVFSETGRKVELLIRRLSPPIRENIVLHVNYNGKLGLSIVGGIGTEYFQNDHGIFVRDIDEHQTNKQFIHIGDRLLNISSTRNIYDLRFVTHEMARKCIKLACARCDQIKLYVGRSKSMEQVQQKTTVLHPEQYDSSDFEDESSVSFNEDNYPTISAKNDEINNKDDQVVDNESILDYQRYKYRSTIVRETPIVETEV